MQLLGKVTTKSRLN